MSISNYLPNSNIKEINKEKKNIHNLTELANYYKTDKGTMYGKKHNYTETYSEKFKNYKDISLLEIGCGAGSSLKMWASFFENSKIYGIDINKNCKNLCSDFENINIFIGNSNDIILNEKFDIIIDDGSHLADDIIKTYNNLNKNLKKNGIYVIEDCHTCCTRHGTNTSYIKFFHSLTKSKMDINKYIKLNNYERLEKFLKEIEKTKKLDKHYRYSKILNKNEFRLVFITNK